MTSNFLFISYRQNILRKLAFRASNDIQLAKNVLHVIQNFSVHTENISSATVELYSAAQGSVA